MIFKLFKCHPKLIRIIFHFILGINILCINMLKNLDKLLQGYYFILQNRIFSQSLFDMVNRFINMLRKFCLLIFKIFNYWCKIVNSLSKSFENIVLLSNFFFILFNLLLKKSLLNLLLRLKLDCSFKWLSILFFLIFLIFLLSLFDELFWLLNLSCQLLIF